MYISAMCRLMIFLNDALYLADACDDLLISEHHFHLTTGHHQWSCEVHAITGQCCSGSTKGTYAKFGRWFKCSGFIKYNTKTKRRTNSRHDPV